MAFFRFFFLFEIGIGFVFLCFACVYVFWDRMGDGVLRNTGLDRNGIGMALTGFMKSVCEYAGLKRGIVNITTQLLGEKMTR